jgi:DNA mismatch endonuclease (patch repair protein)
MKAKMVSKKWAGKPRNSVKITATVDMPSNNRIECQRTDIVSPEKRSEMMSKVRSKDSIAEKKVRSALHAAGYRFRLHRKDLPGTPDIVLPKYRLAIFVHGCFWHRHKGCAKASTPKSNREFWEKKFAENIERDLRTMASLDALKWRVVVIWECETKINDHSGIVAKIVSQKEEYLHGR